MKNKENYILIFDDEILALSYMKDTIEDVKNKIPEFKEYDIIGVSNQTEFWKQINLYKPKILFLDIQMPGKNGIEIARELQLKKSTMNYENQNLPLIIFCTAYDQHAYKAFQVDAIDYILKPVNEDVIEKVLRKILINHQKNLESTDKNITVNSSGLDINIPIKEVVYFKADMKYISVVTAKKEFLINDTLLHLENKFPEFIKIHRSYLINPHFIGKFYKKENSWFVMLKNSTNDSLPVSRRQRGDIEKKINYSILLDN